MPSSFQPVHNLSYNIASGMRLSANTENFSTNSDLQLSDKYRKQGNKLFGEGKFFGAIAQYNKALMCARNDEEQAALCYGNRSAVYLELRYFKHCLHSIDLAEPNFPDDKIQRLKNRRQRCLEFMETEVDKSIDSFNHKFKLSYPANPKLPFFIDALEIKEDQHRGRSLITTTDLKAGDVIAVMDKPWRIPVTNLNLNYLLGCYICGDANNGDLIHGKCRALFCSIKCKDEHDQENFNHKDFIKLESTEDTAEDSLYVSMVRSVENVLNILGGANELRKFIDDHRHKNHTVFDFDWSKADDDVTHYKNMMLATLRDIKKKTPEETLASGQKLEYLVSFLPSDNKLRKMFEDPKHREFLLELWPRVSPNCCISQALQDGEKTRMMSYSHPATKLVNQSG